MGRPAAARDVIARTATAVLLAADPRMSTWRDVHRLPEPPFVVLRVDREAGPFAVDVATTIDILRATPSSAVTLETR